MKNNQKKVNLQPKKLNKLVLASFGIGALMLASNAQAAGMQKAPWQSRSAIKASQTSPIYKQEWRKSAYRSCPILAIPSNSWVHPKTAKSRSANFSDGFAVAYDLSNYKGKPLRSAYGVANAGKTKLAELHAWDYERYYADGSYVTMGHEGNDPNGKMLAYLVLKNGCFYNVWSALGTNHLQQVISQLRYVK